MNTNVKGYITPKNSTRLRMLAETYSPVLLTIDAGAKVEIDQVIKHTETNTLKPAIWIGDEWGKVVKVNNIPIALMRDNLGKPITSAFMAISYHNEQISERHYTTTEPGTEAPTDPDGVKSVDGSTIYWTANDGSSRETKMTPKV